jgi:hypothetical protein
MSHFKSSQRWMHLTPAGLPSGIPGMGEDIDKAMQQAAQFSRHSILQIYEIMIVLFLPFPSSPSLPFFD